jgi:hypothetical protein
MAAVDLGDRLGDLVSVHEPADEDVARCVEKDPANRLATRSLVLLPHPLLVNEPPDMDVTGPRQTKPLSDDTHPPPQLRDRLRAVVERCDRVAETRVVPGRRLNYHPVQDALSLRAGMNDDVANA